MTNEQLEQAASGLMLALDTSTSSMTVALLRQGKRIAQVNSKAERNHSIHLLPTVQKLLREQGYRSSDLESVAVGNGPGSYTGVRIAVTAAKTFSWSLDIPLLSVSSLEALALGANRLGNESDSSALPEGDVGVKQMEEGYQQMEERYQAEDTVCESDIRWLIPLVNARRGQAFTSLFASQQPGYWERLESDGIRLMENWVRDILAKAEQLAESDQENERKQAPDEVIFVGEVGLFAPMIETLTSSWKGKVRQIPHEMKAEDIGILAYDLLLKGETENPYTLVPNYTQLTEAEVKLMRKS